MIEDFGDIPPGQEGVKKQKQANGEEMSDDVLTSEEALRLVKITERNSREIKRITAISLARELRDERLPFPGIDSEHYAKLKAEEEEFPGYATPIDELVERFKNQGMKIVFGKDPESGNVFVLPLDSDDIENDSIFPHHLWSDGILNGQLKELVSLSKDRVKDKRK